MKPSQYVLNIKYSNQSFCSLPIEPSKSYLGDILAVLSSAHPYLTVAAHMLVLSTQ